MTLRGSRVDHAMEGVGTMEVNKEEKKEGSMFEHAAIATVQTSLIEEQATQFMEHHCCPDCVATYLKNDTHHLTMRTFLERSSLPVNASTPVAVTGCLSF